MKKLLYFTAICFLYLFSNQVSYGQGLNYYWVGGGGDWGDLSHWSNASGGLGSTYGYPPSPLDNVIFDENSGFTTTSNIVTTPSYSGITVKNMTWSNAPNNPVFDENPGTDFVVLGNITLQAAMTFRAQVLMMGNQSATITSNGGKIGGNIYIDKENAQVELLDSLMLYHVNNLDSRTGTIVLANGTLETNGHNVYANGFVMHGTNTCHFNFENSTLFFKKSAIGSHRVSNKYYNTSGTEVTFPSCFRIEGANKTINAKNSLIQFENILDGIYVLNNTQYTFDKILYIGHINQVGDQDGYQHYTGHSTFGPAIVKKITLVNSAAHVLNFSNSAVVDTILFNRPSDNMASTDNYQHSRGIIATGTTFKYIKYEGIINPNGTSNFGSRYRINEGNSTNSQNAIAFVILNGCTVDSLLMNQSENTYSFPNLVNNGYQYVNLSNTTVNHVANKAVSAFNLSNQSKVKTYHAESHTFGAMSSNSKIDSLIVRLEGTYQIKNSEISDARFGDNSLLAGTQSQFGRVYFNKIGRISSTSSTFRFAEYNINGWMEGNNNTFDTLVFSPGYTYRFGNGVSNTIRKRWYASGNPCYFTEVYNVGSSGTATINLLAGVPNHFDYIRFWGVKATAAMPINAGVRSINVANNQHINFEPYNALQVLYPFGTDQEVRCHSNYPFTLNTDGFYGNTNTSYTWQDGSQLDSFVVNGPGVYQAQAYYGRNCYYTASYTVLDQLSASVDASLPVSCDPANPSGSLTAIAGGHGGAPYTYEWNALPLTAQPAIGTNQVLDNVHVGQYEVKITDDLNCTATAIGSINGPALELSVTTVVYPDCDPSTSIGTGHIQAVVTGGTAPYSFNWINMPTVTTSFADNLEAGTYKFVVSDSLGCSTDTITVSVGNSTGGFSSSIAITQPINCGLVGSATMTVVGSEVTYQWSHDPSISINTATNIPVGQNYVLAIDKNNCVDQQLVTIIAPDLVAPSFNTCISNIEVFTTGSCGQVVTWNPLTAADVNENCSISTFSSTHQSGDVFPIGVTTVTYSVTDIFGNQGTCSFTVTVVDNEKPQFISCVNDLEIQANSGNCTATASWLTPIVLDNCAVASLTSDFNSGSTFPIGTTTVTYTALDVNGNTETCVFRIIVKAHVNDFRMTSACPVNQTLAIPNNVVDCNFDFEIPTPTYVSNCSNAWFVTGANMYTPGVLYELPIGTHQIKYALTNGADTLACTFTATVVDNLAPQSANLPSNTQYIYADTCGGFKVVPANVTWTDNCGIDSVWTVPADPFMISSIYSNTILTYYAKDVNGLVSSYQVNYYLYPSNPGIVNNCPSDINLLENTCGGAVATWTAPTFSGVCFTTTSSHTSGDLFPVGVTQVTYSFTPESGMTQLCSFNVTVQGVGNSITNCPTDINHVLTGNECSQSVTWTAPVFNSLCTVTSVSSTHQPGDVFQLGTTQVVYTATLSDGTTMTCDFNVVISNPSGGVTTINDCPTNGVLQFFVDPLIDCDNAVVNFTTPTFVSSFCENPVDHVTMTPNTFSQNDALAIGTYPFTYTAYDVNDVVLATCNFTVQVVDTASVFTVDCPGTIINGMNVLEIELDPLTCSGVIDWTLPTFSTAGSCIGAFSHIVQDHGVAPGTAVTSDTYFSNYIQYSGYDVNNQLIGQCSFQVEMIFNDSMYVMHVDTTIYTDVTTCKAPFSWDLPESDIQCDVANVQIFNFSQNWSGILDPYSNSVVQQFPVGQYTITYDVQVGQTRKLVNYLINVLDGNAPTFGTSCPTGPINLYTEDNTCNAIANWSAPVAIGGSCTSFEYIPVTTNVVPGTLLPIGDTLVTYTTHGAGLNTTCSFIVNVFDTIRPSIYVCPSNITVPVSTGCEGVATWIEPSVFDNCSGLSIASNFQSGHSFPLGTTAVNYTITDPSSNSNTCSFTVTVVDGIAPQIVNCPSDIVINSTANLCGGVATWVAPTATDNCSAATLVSNYNSGDLLPIGTTTINYTAMDAANNSTSCSFNVTVLDIHAPSLLNCPSDITINSLHNICARNVMWNAPIASDPCNNSTISSSHQSGDLFEVGTTTVTYYVVDQSGNIDSCSFNVTVTDISAPQVTACPPNQVLELSFNECLVPATWTTPIAIDNCSDVSLMSTHISGDQFPIGTTIITYTATDTQGLQDVCSFTINVIDPNNYCGGSVAPGKEIVVPDAFTPDGDGVNDVLVIEGIEHYPDNEMIIFNRWGTEVYRSAGYSNQWDGKINVGSGLEGSELPTGTYFYILDTKDKVLGVLKGYIYLQR